MTDQPSSQQPGKGGGEAKGGGGGGEGQVQGPNLQLDQVTGEMVSKRFVPFLPSFQLNPN